jgi:hypothetical protein
MKQKSLCYMLSIACFTVTGFSALAQWKETGIRADWSGRDFACSMTQVPNNGLCNAATRGLVAVCWASRKTGECGGAVAWCTYKRVTLQTIPDGAAPGEVYVCN